jgi:hypothetical protein
VKIVEECRGCGSPHFRSSSIRIAPFVAERMLRGEGGSTANECLSCGLIWCGVHPDIDALSRYYEDYWGESYVSHRLVYEPEVTTRHSHLLGPREADAYVEEFVGFVPERVLDIGGGTGDRSPFRGVSEVHVLDVAHGDPAEGVSYVDSAEGKYDLVVLSHVLEHVPDPSDLLSTAAFSSSGVLYVEVPDEASLYGARPRLSTLLASRREWHEHLNYFDSCSISALVKRCGLEVIELRQESGLSGPFIRLLAK